MRLGRQEGFYGAVKLDFNFKHGNSRITQLGQGVRLSFTLKRHTVFFINNIQFGKSRGEDFVNNGFSHLRYNLRIFEWFVYEIFSQHEWNEFTLLEARALLGTGVRFVILRQEKMEVVCGLSYMLEYERLDITEDMSDQPETLFHRSSNYLVIKIELTPGTLFFNTIYFQPRFKDLSDFRVLDEGGIMVKLTKDISLGLSLNLRYDSKPPTNTKPLDIEMKNFLYFQF
jgi:hypothetical protein